MELSKNFLCVKNTRAHNSHDIIYEQIDVMHSTLQYEWK